MKRESLYVVVALAGGVFGGLAGGRLGSTASIAAQVQKTIAAQEILLVDGKGNTRGALRLNPEGEPNLAFYGHDGKLRAAFDITNEEGLAFRLTDSSGTTRISMTINSDEIPALRLFDARAHPRALIGVDPEGESALDFYSQQGKLLRELP
jgi:hypothetical protein